MLIYTFRFSGEPVDLIDVHLCSVHINDTFIITKFYRYTNFNTQGKQTWKEIQEVSGYYLSRLDNQVVASTLNSI